MNDKARYFFMLVILERQKTIDTLDEILTRHGESFAENEKEAMLDAIAELDAENMEWKSILEESDP